MHGLGDNVGYWMYAYLQCDCSTKTFYNPSLLCFLYLHVQVIINNKTHIGQPSTISWFISSGERNLASLHHLAMLLLLVLESCQTSYFQRDLLSSNTTHCSQKSTHSKVLCFYKQALITVLVSTQTPWDDKYVNLIVCRLLSVTIARSIAMQGSASNQQQGEMDALIIKVVV